MSNREALIAHLKTGATTTCRAWSVTRKDGQRLGFTDHDRDLLFEGTTFKASSGMTAGALQHSDGMSVDNMEVIGALSDASISETDIAAGRYDAAEVVAYLINWADLSQWSIRFRGRFGEIRRSSGMFTVELRGLTEALNASSNRIYQPTCPAILGDGECRFDLNRPGFSLQTVIKAKGENGEYYIPSQSEVPDRWFERGRFRILSGKSTGIQGIVKLDNEIDGKRRIEPWVDPDSEPDVGDEVRLEAGCDKSAGTCRDKFGNFSNFRGFPHVPNTDWMTSYPVSTQRNDGGSREK